MVGERILSMEKPIIHDPFRLGRKSVPAVRSDLPILDDLHDTLLAHQDTCVGMAANMIGQDVCIIVFFQAGAVREMLNPIIVGRQGPYQTEEPCLSVSGSHPVTRYREITVAWQDRNLRTHRDKFIGYTAQIIQHEVDHCNGVLI